MWIKKLIHTERLNVEFRAHRNVLALPLSIGGGVWEDAEIGEYGARYGCDYFRAVIITFLFVSLRFDYMLDEEESPWLKV